MKWNGTKRWNGTKENKNYRALQEKLVVFCETLFLVMYICAYVCVHAYKHVY